MPADCRIRRLRIQSRKSVAVPRVTAMLQEAFRTASLQSVPANGVLCVRRLDLGRIRNATNSQFVSRRLDQLVKNLSAVQITAEAPEREGSVVWFADDIEPYRCILRLLAQGRLPRAWYWRAVVPGWSQAMDTSKTVMLCISQLARKSTGITGLSYALEPLVSAGAMLKVFHEVRPRELDTITSGLSLSPVPISTTGLRRRNMSNVRALTEKAAAVQLPEPWQALLRGALRQWRTDDSRLRLVFNMALNIAGLKPDTAHGEALLRAIAHPGIATAGADEAGVSPARGIEGESAKAAFDETLKDNAAVDADRAIRKTAGGSDFVESSAFDDASAPARNESSGINARYGSDALAKPRSLTDSGDEPGDCLEAHGRRETGSPGRDRAAPVPVQLGMVGNYTGEASAHGGFLFLIPLMQRLGIFSVMDGETGEADPHLLLRLLWRIARWMKIPVDDPVLQFLDRPYEPKPDMVPFEAPAQWRGLFETGQNTKIAFAKVRRQPDINLIIEPASRLILAAYRADPRVCLPGWLERYPRHSRSLTVETWSTDDLVNNLVIAMCRYLRLYAQMSMRSLVRRHAHIAVTRTHVDWSARLSKLENRVRIAGLDIDPGWVPRLQRVFYFHYIDEET